MGNKRALMLGGLLAGVVFSACSEGSSVEVEAGPGESEAPAVVARPEREPAADGLPGYAALRSVGCDPSVETPGQLEVYEQLEWAPIADLVATSPVAVVGRVTDLSAPRFTTPGADAVEGIPNQVYFRLMTVAVEETIELQSESAMPSGSSLDVILFGAGPRVDADELCFGPDGFGTGDELPLGPGDQVLVLGDFGSFGIPGLDRDVLFLTWAQLGLWRVDDDRIARSVSPELSTEFEVLRARIVAEAEALADGRTLDIEDSLSVPPEDDPAPPTTFTTTPIPGSDAPDTETIPPPDDDAEG